MGALPAASGCTLLVDTNVDQCTTAADCTARGGAFADALCSADHVCVTAACTTNQQCLDAHPGEKWICRHADRRCGRLDSIDCKTLLAEPGDLANDATLWLGTLLPTVGENASTGLPNQNGVEVARRDFRTINGLPPTGPGKPQRPLAFVACNDGADPIRAAKHLVDDVKVPGIIGPAFSGVLIKVATEVTIPGGTLIISPSATSPFITKLQKHGLVWRTAPPDTVQSVAISLLLAARIEPDLRAPTGGVLKAGEQLRLAVVHKGDAYGQGLANALFDIVKFNAKGASDNGANYKAIDYGDPAAPDADARYKAAVDGLLAFQPHVLIVIGTAESVTKVFTPFEAGWTEPTFRPRYVLADGAEIPEVIAAIGTNADLRHRVLGTVPGTTAPLYQKFVSHYLSTITDGTQPDQYTAAAYDAAYLLAYASVVVGDQPITGAALDEGLKHTVPPGKVEPVGEDAITEALNELLAKRNIDFDGASGPLDFDVDAGEAQADIQIWCVSADATGKASAIKNSGMYYSATTKKLEGAISCP
ncbi:MAG: hypothetical protein NVSMB47_17850 [Polyangiales bacterium]